MPERITDDDGISSSDQPQIANVNSFRLVYATITTHIPGTPSFLDCKAYGGVSQIPRCGVNAAEVNAVEDKCCGDFLVVSVNAEVCMVHGRMQRFNQRLHGPMRLFSTALEILFSRFEVARPTYVEK